VILAIGIPVGAAVVLSKSSAPAPVSVAPILSTTPAGVLPPDQESALVSSPPHQKTKVFTGHESNPFAITPVKKAKTPRGGTTTTTPATTTPSTGTTTASTSPGATMTAPHKPTSPAKPVGAPSKLGSHEVYTANLTTTYGTEKDTLNDVQRLTPLPPNNAPELVFLGVLKGGKKAVFLLTNEVAATLTASKSAGCVPSLMACQVLELKVGETIKLVPAKGTTGVSKFQLKLTALGFTRKSTSAEATADRKSASVTGQQIVATSSSTALADFFYNVGLGALVYQKPAPGTGSTGASGTSGASGATGTT
jgi:hypothetical protein